MKFALVVLLSTVVSCIELPQPPSPPDETEELVALDLCGFGEVGTVDSAGNITTAGSCHLRGAGEAAEFNGRRIIEVQGELRIDGGGELETLSFDSLERVGALVVTQNQGLRFARLGALFEIQNYVTVGVNPLLESFTAPLLRSVGTSIVVQENPLLDFCEIESLLANLESQPPTVLLDGECSE